MSCRLFFAVAFLAAALAPSGAASADEQVARPTVPVDGAESLEPGLYVIVGIRHTPKEAQLLLSDVAMLGIRGRIERGLVNKKPAYRILSGPFQNREIAEKAKLKLENNSLSKNAEIKSLSAAPAKKEQSGESDDEETEEDEESGAVPEDEPN